MDQTLEALALNASLSLIPIVIGLQYYIRQKEKFAAQTQTLYQWSHERLKREIVMHDCAKDIYTPEYKQCVLNDVNSTLKVAPAFAIPKVHREYLRKSFVAEYQATARHLLRSLKGRPTSI
ncbi:MAG TPA: hypothetical protein VK158_01020 [Acidobacteriota bacterium]|nr:hypothetical protein [Acidobacteriota bacterium]